MKRIVLFCIAITVSFYISGQTTKNVYVSTAGTLNTLLTENEANNVTSLVISGNVDARDFAFVRDKAKAVSIIDMSSVSITGYKGIDGTNTGVDTEYPANEIPSYAFYNPVLKTYKQKLVSFKFPTSTKSIGYLAFNYCWNLSGIVSIPASVTRIADYAFYGCSSISSFSTPGLNTRYSTLNGVLFNKTQDTLFLCPTAKAGAYTIPATVKHIGPSAFENTYALTSIIFPPALESIGSYAFCYSNGISGTLSLPTSLKKADDGAFYGCKNLSGTVFIPATLTQIGSYCFFESNNIQSFNVNSSNPRYSSLNDALYSKKNDTLYICPGGKVGTFEIPPTVKLIGSHAFYKCNKIGNSMNIPGAVDYIGYYAFYGCTLINNFTVNSDNVYFKSDKGALYSKTGDRLISCPVSKSGEFQIPATVKYVDPAALAFCNKITGALTIPAATEQIGEYAFYGCDLISDFVVETGNKRYSSRDGIVFNAVTDSLLICPLSKSGIYTIPQGVKHIGLSAFDGCSKLTNVELPATIESIGNYAFEYCSGLTTIQIPQHTLNIGSGAFYNCSNLQEFSIANPSPPVVDYYTFDLVNKTVCSLKVPTGTLTTYQNSPYWNEFANIQEKTFFDGFTEVKNDLFKIIHTENGILLKADFPLSEIKIFDILGRLVFSQYVNDNQTDIALTKHGYYIIKVKDKSTKFLH